MSKEYTNSQKIRFRLKKYWDTYETGFEKFEDFYDFFTESLLDNLEFIADTFNK